MCTQQLNYLCYVNNLRIYDIQRHETGNKISERCLRMRKLFSMCTAEKEKKNWIFNSHLDPDPSMMNRIQLLVHLIFCEDRTPIERIICHFCMKMTKESSLGFETWNHRQIGPLLNRPLSNQPSR